MIDPAALQMVLGVLTGWLDRREREAVAYLIEENRLLRRQLAYAAGFNVAASSPTRNRISSTTLRNDWPSWLQCGRVVADAESSVAFPKIVTPLMSPLQCGRVVADAESY